MRDILVSIRERRVSSAPLLGLLLSDLRKRLDYVEMLCGAGARVVHVDEQDRVLFIEAADGRLRGVSLLHDGGPVEYVEVA